MGGPLRMATMPAPSPTGQPDAASQWFGSAEGLCLLQSEAGVIGHVLGERPALPWLWLAPTPAEPVLEGRGLLLTRHGRHWAGDVRCGLPLPVANGSMGTVVLQHALPRDARGDALLEECARVLAPGGRLCLFALNPLSPYRWRWRAVGLHATEPLSSRRRLRAAGLSPEPLSQGIGPRWRVGQSAELQQGAGLRAAYLLRAEKRRLPLTPVRARNPLALAQGVPAA